MQYVFSFRRTQKKGRAKPPTNMIQSNNFNTQTLGFPRKSPKLNIQLDIRTSQLPDISPQEKALSNKGDKKYLGQSISFLMRRLYNSPLWKYYRRMAFCCCHIDEVNGRLISKYCRSRLCPICGGIRTAIAKHGYGPHLLPREKQIEQRQYHLNELEKIINACINPKERERLEIQYTELEIKPYVEPMEDPYFITLTTCNTDVIGLDELIKRRRAHDKAYSKMMKAARNGRTGVRGISNRETTARPGNRFHDHIHSIVDGEEHAAWMIKYWTRAWGVGMASREAQHMRKADAGAYKEIFKYMTKLTTVIKEVKRVDNGLNYWEDHEPFEPAEDAKLISDYQLDTICRANRGRIMLRAFGGIRRVKDSDYALENLISQCYGKEIKGNRWRWMGRDWAETMTGELLTGNTPSKAVLRLFGMGGEKDWIDYLKREAEKSRVERDYYLLNDDTMTQEREKEGALSTLAPN